MSYYTDELEKIEDEEIREKMKADPLMKKIIKNMEKYDKKFKKLWDEL